MVKLLSLAAADDDPNNNDDNNHPQDDRRHTGGESGAGGASSTPDRIFDGFIAALGCYPIVSQLACLLDLNSLDALSRTCRQARYNLLLHQKLLKTKTLRCVNEQANPARRLGDYLKASHDAWRTYARNGIKVGRINSGNIGACARDMVSECRKCGQVVCRNCIVKPPPAPTLKGRHRRLCRTCIKCPLHLLTSFVPNQDASYGSDQFTSPAFARLPCTCESHVWLCIPCGQSLRTDDVTYIRGWAWRSRYSTCGGIGAGLGQGNEGVECGRDGDCLAAREVFKEVEYDAEELTALEVAAAGGDSNVRGLLGSSYITQEIVGIGGRVKKKVKTRVLVGDVVKEYEVERETGKFLLKELEAVNRSWCSWCFRVIPSSRDLDRFAVSPSSSEASLIP